MAKITKITNTKTGETYDIGGSGSSQLYNHHIYFETNSPRVQSAKYLYLFFDILSPEKTPLTTDTLIEKYAGRDFTCSGIGAGVSTIVSGTDPIIFVFNIHIGDHTISTDDYTPVQKGNDCFEISYFKMPADLANFSKLVYQNFMDKFSIKDATETYGIKMTDTVSPI